MTSLKDQFLLDPKTIFLNHGSYGATPRAVFEDFQRRQLQLERDPVRFINTELPVLLKEAKTRFSNVVAANPDTDEAGRARQYIARIDSALASLP